MSTFDGAWDASWNGAWLGIALTVSTGVPLPDPGYRVAHSPYGWAAVTDRAGYLARTSGGYEVVFLAGGLPVGGDAHTPDDGGYAASIPVLGWAAVTDRAGYLARTGGGYEVLL